MAPRFPMLALFGCPWTCPPTPCCTGLLEFTLPIPGFKEEPLLPLRSSESCLCLEAASGTRFPLLFKRPNSPLGISSSGRSFSKSNKDPKSVLSLAEKPGELSLARLGLGGPSSKFSAMVAEAAEPVIVVGGCPGGAELAVPAPPPHGNPTAPLSARPAAPAPPCRAAAGRREEGSGRGAKGPAPPPCRPRSSRALPPPRCPDGGSGRHSGRIPPPHTLPSPRPVPSPPRRRLRPGPRPPPARGRGRGGRRGGEEKRRERGGGGGKN